MSAQAKRWNAPNIISLLRLICSPFLLVAAWQGKETLFLVLYIAGMLSDFVDGILAKLLNMRTHLGALLDSWGDGALYICAAIGALILWPERMLAQLPLFVTAFALISLSAGICFIKHHKSPSYHSQMTRLASCCIGLTAVLLFLDLPNWPFQVAVGMLALSSVEAIAITLALPTWQTDVPSIFHAFKIRKRLLEDK